MNQFYSKGLWLEEAGGRHLLEGTQEDWMPRQQQYDLPREEVENVGEQIAKSKINSQHDNIPYSPWLCSIYFCHIFPMQSVTLS